MDMVENHCFMLIIQYRSKPGLQLNTTFITDSESISNLLCKMSENGKKREPIIQGFSKVFRCCLFPEPPNIHLALL